MSKTSFAITYTEGVSEDLADLHAFERKRILDEIDKQLTYDATRLTKYRKYLSGLSRLGNILSRFGNCVSVSTGSSMTWMKRNQQ